MMRYAEVRTRLPEPLWEFVKNYASLKGITAQQALGEIIIHEMERNKEGITERDLAAAAIGAVAALFLKAYLGDEGG